MGPARVRRLPPWRETSYFNVPTVTTFNLSGSAPTQLAQPNINRVALLISANAGNYVLPGEEPVTQNVGLPVGPNVPALCITEAQYGPLAQLAWWAAGGGTGTGIATVIEVVLREWPEQLS